MNPRKQPSVARYACWACGYDLRASPERCPECGHDRQAEELRRTREAQVSKRAGGLFDVLAISLLVGTLAYAAGRDPLWSDPLMMITLAVSSAALASLVAYVVARRRITDPDHGGPNRTRSVLRSCSLRALRVVSVLMLFAVAPLALARDGLTFTWAASTAFWTSVLLYSKPRGPGP